GLRERIVAAVLDTYRSKRGQIGKEVADQLEKQLMLQILDRHWKEHLAGMDYLRQGIHLRGYAQKNPEQEYKREAFQLFEQLLGAVKLELVQTLARIEVQSPEEVAALEAQRQAEAEHMRMQFQHADAAAAEAEFAAQAGEAVPLADETAAQEAQQSTFVREGAKVGRNDPCPCGSGKKYKHCHGQLA
ncbi:MAG TPA: SEC-C metal-binding domain-containing protein, partial [Moraxellaceae bacterium]|nr:SEC-C metal-binding domain-containing protein [Moraxellaceae bacterium]